MVSVSVNLVLPDWPAERILEERLSTYLDEAGHPDAVVQGALVLTGDEEAPVVARVLRLEDRPGGTMVVMSLVGTAAELERVLRAPTTAA